MYLQVEELSGKLAAVESVWTEKLHDTIQRHKSKVDSLQGRLKVCQRYAQCYCYCYVRIMHFSIPLHAKLQLTLCMLTCDSSLSVVVLTEHVSLAGSQGEGGQDW